MSFASIITADDKTGETSVYGADCVKKCVVCGKTAEIFAVRPIPKKLIYTQYFEPFCASCYPELPGANPCDVHLHDWIYEGSGRRYCKRCKIEQVKHTETFWKGIREQDEDRG